MTLESKAADHYNWPRITHYLLIGVAVWAHLQFALQGFNTSLNNGKAAAFAFNILIEHPTVIRQLGGPILFVVLLYALLFTAIGWLGRTSRTTPTSHAIGIVLASWTSAWWLILVAQVRLVPRSNWSWWAEPLAHQSTSPLLTSAAFIFLAVRIWQKRQLADKFSLRWASGAAVITVVLLIGAGISGGLSAQTTGIRDDMNIRPNVIIIGLDSLRRDLLLEASAEHLPNLAALRDRSYVEANVVTPLARTFPAWVSILTGMQPNEHGARDNLAPQQFVKREKSLGWWMKERGYRTVYATDETRFSNIGREFGFDQIVGPTPGVSDFLLAQFSDQPLINLAVLIPGAELLLPSLVGNRAFAQAYRPQRFIDRLEAEVSTSTRQPQFLVIHLCTAHWPYYSAQSRSLTPGGDGYDRAASELDEQLGSLLAMLERRGYLDPSTLLVVLADHGEGLNRDLSSTLSISTSEGVKAPSPPIGGHGSTLLNPAEWQVFTLYSGQSVLGRIPSGTSKELAALQDVSPTLKNLLGGMAEPRRMTVVDATAPQQVARVPRDSILIETGFRPRGFDPTRPDGEKALRIAASTFDVQKDGRVTMKADRYLEAIENKDYGVTDGSAMLAVVRSEGESVVVSTSDAGWMIYPVERPTSMSAIDSPLTVEACRHDEIVRRIPSWCRSTASESAH